MRSFGVHGLSGFLQLISEALQVLVIISQRLFQEVWPTAISWFSQNIRRVNKSVVGDDHNIFKSSSYVFAFVWRQADVARFGKQVSYICRVLLQFGWSAVDLGSFAERFSNDFFCDRCHFIDYGEECLFVYLVTMVKLR